MRARIWWEVDPFEDEECPGLVRREEPLSGSEEPSLGRNLGVTQLHGSPDLQCWL